MSGTAMSSALPPVALESGEAASRRILSIDLLRGIVMILMALDHARIYFGATPFAPDDPSQTTPGWFATRWVAHFCAPVFVFLAGTSVFLVRSRGMGRGALTRRLLTRGLWLVLLELTLIGASWGFLFGGVWVLQVIWAIGISMIVLAGLVWLPTWLVGAIGLAMIGSHNLFDGWAPETEVTLVSDAWRVLHVQAGLQTFGVSASGWPRVLVVYPLIPWIGVMAAGYAFGKVALSARRDALCVLIGALSVALFVLLRWFQLYGDPNDRVVYDDEPVRTFMSFLHTQKYPPSLQFLLMTLGPAILAIPPLERVAHRATRLTAPVLTFGRVAMFYYVLHIPLAHVTGGLLSLVLYDRWVAWALTGQYPETYESRLWVVYAAWVLIVLLLYPACAWYAGYRARKRSWWMTYL